MSKLFYNSYHSLTDLEGFKKKKIGTPRQIQKCYPLPVGGGVVYDKL